jgi:hypothetical protein
LSNIPFLNFDSHFFKIETPDIKELDPFGGDVSKYVTSFEVTEEIGRMMHGSISLLETDHDLFGKVLGMGKKINVKWGYKNLDLSGQTAYTKMNNTREVFGKGIAQRYAKAIIKEPSGGGDQRGIKMYNCNFVSYDMFGWKSKIFDAPGLTKMVVIQQVLLDMQITLSFIKFTRGKEMVYGDTAIRQDNSSNFRFLNQMATEWRCLFRIGYNQAGIAVALFCDYDDDNSIKQFFTSTIGGIGDSILLEYKFGKANVKSYSWSHSESANGTGDNVRMNLVNGQPQIIRTVATSETVTAYKLDVDKIKNEFAAVASNPSSVMKHASDLMQNQTMEELVAKKYFIPYTSSTAPQGIGFSINVDCIGNPLCTAPARIKFGEGFPGILKNKKGLIFYVQSVTHKIDSSGYNMSLKILDSYTFTGGVGVG